VARQDKKTLSPKSRKPVVTPTVSAPPAGRGFRIALGVYLSWLVFLVVLAIRQHGM
jgi:hypothetical protein